MKKILFLILALMVSRINLAMASDCRREKQCPSENGAKVITVKYDIAQVDNTIVGVIAKTAENNGAGSFWVLTYSQQRETLADQLRECGSNGLGEFTLEYASLGLGSDAGDGKMETVVGFTCKNDK